MKDSHKGLIISIVAVVAVVIIGAGSYYLSPQHKITRMLADPTCTAVKAREDYRPQFIDVSKKTGLIVEEDKNYYDVNGTDAAGLYHDVHDCVMPLYGLDKGVDATTVSNISYNFNYSIIDYKICNLTNVAVGARISYLLPKWTHATEATGPLADMWNTYFAAQQKHEEHHATLIKEYANKLYTYINGLSVNKTCVTRVKDVQAQYDLIVGELNKALIQYDADTDHGAKEGIFTPFSAM